MTATAAKRAEQPALRQARMLINGQWVGAASGEILTVQNPANRQPIAEIPRGRAEDVDRAVKAAEAAYPAWSRVAPRERGKLFLKIADALEARVEELARLHPQNPRAGLVACRSGSFVNSMVGGLSGMAAKRQT